MDELLMNPFGPKDELLRLFGRIKEQIEHDQQFMDLSEEWTGESFGMQQHSFPQHSFPDHRGMPFQRIDPSGPPEASNRRHSASGPDSQLSWSQAAQQLRQLGALVCYLMSLEV